MKVSDYEFWTRVTGGGILPATVRISTTPDESWDDPEATYAISGTVQLGENARYVTAKPEAWKIPPHVAFANLRADDPRAAEAFCKRYGLLTEHALKKNPSHDTGIYKEFWFDSGYVLIMQDELRKAWTPDFKYKNLFHVEDQVSGGMRSGMDVEEGCACLTAKDLWTLILFLYLRDFVAGKIGLCENPECPAPYFVKRRRTQKFCEAGACTDYAHRQYALKWWNTDGKSRRDAKKAKR